MAIEMVKSVEACDITVGAAATKGSYTLTKGQDTSNCVPFCTWETSSTTDQQDYLMVDVYFEAGPKVSAERVSAGTNTLYVRVYVVEFEPSRVSVQQGTYTIATVTTDSNNTVTTVDQDRAAAIAYHKTNFIYENPEYTYPLCFFTSNTNLRLSRMLADSSYVSGHYYIFECLNEEWTVQAISSGLQAANPVTVTLSTPVVMDRTFIVGSYYSDPTSNYVAYGACWLYLTSTTQVELRAYSNSDNKYFKAFVIECADDAIFVQRGEVFIDGSPRQQYGTDTLSTAVNLDKAMVFSITSTTPVRSAGTTTWYYAYGRYRLIDTTTVRVDVYKAHDRDQYAKYEVVEFPTSELYCEGTVTIDDIPASGVEVRLHRRSTHEYLGNDFTTSSGTFEIASRHQDEHYAIAFSEWEWSNSLILDGLLPTTVS